MTHEQKTEEVTWYTIDQPDGKKIAAWKRTVIVSETGDLYIPGCLATDERLVFLTAGFDGVDYFVRDNHAYYPAEWMAREWAHLKPTVEAIAARLRRQGLLQ